MENDTKDGLSKLLKVFNADRIISQDEIKEILTGIVKILADNKRGVESLNEQSKSELSEALKSFALERNKLLEVIRNDLGKSKSEIEKLTKETNDRAFKNLQARIAKIKIPKDGKDADQAAIVAAVLEQIKLPESTVLDNAGQIRDKLETLKDDDRLDASAIKGWEKFLGTIKNKGKDMLVGGIRFFENLADVSIVITKKRADLLAQYNTTNNRWQDGVALTVSTTAPSSPQANDVWIDTN